VTTRRGRPSPAGFAWIRIAAARPARIAGLFSAAWLIAFCAPVRKTPENMVSGHCEFGPAQSLGPVVNSQVFDGSPTVSSDETELYFTSARAGQQDIFVSTRPTREAAWSAPVNVGLLVNDPTGDDFSLRLSSDGVSLYFASTRGGGFGKADLYVATRASKRQPWGRASNLGPVLNTDAFEAFPTPTADGRSLYFNRSVAFDSQDSDIWVSSRAGPAEQWTAPQRLPGSINSERAEFSPSVSPDGNTLYFASQRSGSIEVWVSSRRPGQEWGDPMRLGAGVNVPLAMTLAPFVTANQRSLYFMAARPDAGQGACVPMTCFNRVDLYVAAATCR
jgi:Tol biopolymer transport system component